MKYIHSQESLTIPEGGEFISVDFFGFRGVRKSWRLRKARGEINKWGILAAAGGNSN